MNIEALIQLKRVLRESMAHTIVFQGKTVGFDMDTFCDINECGTAACAAGSAAMDPWFNARGFIMHTPRCVMDNPIPYVEYDDYYGGVIQKTQVYGFRACERFFDISYLQCGWLFAPRTYPAGPITQTQVIERIDELLSKANEENK